MKAIKIPKTPTLRTMEALVEELKLHYETVAMQVEARSYTKTHFALYATGISIYSWEYFESWKELTDFCLKLVKEKRGAKE